MNLMNAPSWSQAVAKKEEHEAAVAANGGNGQHPEAVERAKEYVALLEVCANELGR
jgi:hypothetical protein